MVYIGSARIDENGQISGGVPGDQKQIETPDMAGEVSICPFYFHEKGWNIIRWKDKNYAAKAAWLMEYACNNRHIGYSQARRYDILRDGISSEKDTSCDCTSLVRQIIKEATGRDPGEFYTGSMVGVLSKMGLFDIFPYSASTALELGDILVTKSSGHTAVVVDIGEKEYRYIDCDELNLRSAPSMDAEVIAAMPFGSRLEFLGEAAGWANVSFGGKIGYCGNGYLAKDEPQKEYTAKEDIIITALLKGQTAKTTGCKEDIGGEMYVELIIDGRKVLVKAENLI